MVSTSASRRRRAGAYLRDWWSRRRTSSGKHRPDVVAVRLFEANVRMFGVRRAIGTTPVQRHPLAAVSSSSPSAAEPPSIEFATVPPAGSAGNVSAVVNERRAMSRSESSPQPTRSALPQSMVPNVPRQRSASWVGLNAYRAR